MSRSEPGGSELGHRAEQIARRVRVARGLEPGDLLLRAGRIANVFTGRLDEANIVVADGYIAGLGPYEWQAAEVIDLGDKLVLPGLIDAHMHLESTLLTPAEFSRVAVPHGTSAVVLDPHEIANVLGTAGIELLRSAAADLPLDFLFMAPSCVPAAPWEHAGAELGPDAVRQLLDLPGIGGLAEMMNLPGLLGGADDVLAKLAAAAAAGKPIDGHAPGLSGQELVAYVAAGVRSDHESTTLEEARAKAALGMLLQVREGSSARNLDTLMPLIIAGELGDWCLATDDVHADELLAEGHIDVRLQRVVAVSFAGDAGPDAPCPRCLPRGGQRVVAAGLPLPEAVRHVTLVPARHYGLRDRGAVAPGYVADLVVVDGPERLRPTIVIKRGQVVAIDGRLTAELPEAARIEPENTVRIGRIDEQAFVLPLSSEEPPVIGLVQDQIVTRKLRMPVARSAAGIWQFDPSRDLALIASVERHKASGRVAVGLVSGFGFKRHGALGSSVAHDSHNLIIAGTNAADMLASVRRLAELGGGFVVMADGAVQAELPLPVAGLLSTEPAETVSEQLGRVTEAARSLGCKLQAPFGTLSFLALSVIPELRITDAGVFDVLAGTFVRL